MDMDVAVSEASTRDTSIELSFSDVESTQLDMEIPDLHMETQDDAGLDKNGQVKVATLERDHVYFYQNVFIVAEDRIFCVPKIGLIEDGSHFRSLLSDNDAGRLEENPIVLNGVSKSNFHNFLTQLYPFRNVQVPSGDEAWLGILDLATKWGFEQVRDIAISQLSHLFLGSASRCQPYNPIYALFLCQKYDIHQYIKKQFEAIITSIKPLNHSEMLKGGLDANTVFLLLDLREKWTAGKIWGEKGSGTSLSNIFPRRLSAKRIVEDHFASLDHDSSVTPNEKGGNASDAAWVQEEVKRLEVEVATLEEIEKKEDEMLLQNAEESARVAMKEEESSLQRTSPGCSSNSVERFKHLLDGSSVFDEVVSDDADQCIKKLILMHGDKNEISKQIKDLRGRGVDKDNVGIQVLIKMEQTQKSLLERYWQKVSGLPLSESLGACSRVDISVLQIDDARYKIQRAIQRLLHPDAVSLNLEIIMGKEKDSILRRQTIFNDIQSRYGLERYTTTIRRKKNLAGGFTSCKARTTISDLDFESWLEQYFVHQTNG